MEHSRRAPRVQVNLSSTTSAGDTSSTDCVPHCDDTGEYSSRIYSYPDTSMFQTPLCVASTVQQKVLKPRGTERVSLSHKQLSSPTQTKRKHVLSHLCPPRSRPRPPCGCHPQPRECQALGLTPDHDVEDCRADPDPHEDRYGDSTRFHSDERRLMQHRGHPVLPVYRGGKLSSPSRD